MTLSHETVKVLLRTCVPNSAVFSTRGLEHWIGSIPHGTGPLDRLALPHWCVHWGGDNKHGRYRIEVHAAEAVSSPLSPSAMAV